jgi:hypothetical protein
VTFDRCLRSSLRLLKLFARLTVLDSPQAPRRRRGVPAPPTTPLPRAVALPLCPHHLHEVVRGRRVLEELGIGEFNGERKGSVDLAYSVRSAAWIGGMDQNQEGFRLRVYFIQF